MAAGLTYAVRAVIRAALRGTAPARTVIVKTVMPQTVMARLVQATYSTTLPRQVARTSRAMTGRARFQAKPTIKPPSGNPSAW
jgi:hypothetical protein